MALHNLLSIEIVAGVYANQAILKHKDPHSASSSRDALLSERSDAGTCRSSDT